MFERLKNWLDRKLIGEDYAELRSAIKELSIALETENFDNIKCLRDRVNYYLKKVKEKDGF